MKLSVNGENRDYRGEPTLEALLRECGAPCEGVAVILNDDVIPRTQRAATHVREGDRIELVTLAGGG